METLKTALAWIAQLETLPAGALTVVFCISLGYVLKFTPSFINSRIPVWCWLAGGLFYSLMAPASPANPMIVQEGVPLSTRARLFGIGVVLGIAAWLIHNQLLKRLEDSNLMARLLPGLSKSFDLARTNPPMDAFAVEAPPPPPPPPVPPADPPKTP